MIKKIPSVALKIILIGTALYLVLLILAPAMGSSAVDDFMYHLITGWVRHAYVNVPALEWNLLTILLSTASLVGALYLFNGLVRRNWARDWKMGSSIKVLLLFLLTSGGAIAMTGIVHQAVWLSKTKIYQTNHKYKRTEAMSNARQLYLAMLEMEMENNLPHNLEDIRKWMNERDHGTEILTYTTSDYRSKRPFLLLQPGKPLSELPSETPILAALEAEGGKPVIVTASGQAKVLSLSEFEDLFEDHP